jgi:hypothetical protein
MASRTVKQLACVFVSCIGCGFVQPNPTPRLHRRIDGVEYGITACTICGGIWARYACPELLSDGSVAREATE